MQGNMHKTHRRTYNPRDQSPNYKTTNHWKTTYNHFNTLANNVKLKRRTQPEWSLIKEAHTSTRGYYDTEHECHFGTYGDRPRDKLPSTATKMQTMMQENFEGTPKLTMHIPGYTGFIPQSDACHEAANQSFCANTRTTFMKSNVTET